MTTYSSAAERAKTAGALFQAVADKYGMTPDGQNARYFAGLTYIEAARNQQAEEALKKVAADGTTISPPWPSSPSASSTRHRGAIPRPLTSTTSSAPSQPLRFLMASRSFSLPTSTSRRARPMPPGRSTRP